MWISNIDFEDINSLKDIFILQRWNIFQPEVNIGQFVDTNDTEIFPKYMCIVLSLSYQILSC